MFSKYYSQDVAKNDRQALHYERIALCLSSFETENGIYASESGKPVEGYGDEESYDVNGQFSYTGPDGVVYKVVYVADANGFQPQGAHLPTPVPTEYPTPEASDDDDDEERYEAPEEPQYERVIVGYKPRYQ